MLFCQTTGEAVNTELKHPGILFLRLGLWDAQEQGHVKDLG